MPTYAASSGKIPELAADVGAVLPIALDFLHLQTVGDTLAAIAFDASEGIAIGDGSTSFPTKAGPVTPPVPDITTDPTKCVFFVHLAQAGDWRLAWTYRTAGNESDGQSCIFRASTR